MDIISKRKIFYFVSGTLLSLGLIAIIVWHIRFGIDFTGGSLLELANNPSEQVLQTTFKEQGIDEIQIQRAENTTMVRFKTIDQAQKDEIVAKLKEKDPTITENSFQFVGPTVGADLTNKGIWALVLASIAIILYIAFSFREVPKPTNSWRFGLTAVIALLHDVLFVLGFWAIYSHFTNAELDSLFIPAILTIIGFSVHDTIVVFDRTRENLRKHRVESAKAFEQVANTSLSQTVIRSLSTSFTVILTLLALYLLGGASIKNFTLTLLVGIVAGTYSSIFVATALLVSWQFQADKRKPAKVD